MSCVDSSCCDCQGSCQPVSSSGAAICAAHSATVGTCDTINALISNGTSALTAIVKGEQQQKQLAVKAQTQIAQSSIQAVTLVVIAIAAIVGFLYFGSRK